MPRVWNKHDPNTPKGAAYVGRPSKWGNPFRIGAGDSKRDRAQAVEEYRAWLPTSGLDPTELRGRDLVCWCAPLPCHGDVLLELANREPAA